MQAYNLRSVDDVLKNALPRTEEYPGFGNLVSTVLLQMETTAAGNADMRAEIQQLRKEMSAKDDQMKTMENSYTECMKALKDKEEADKKEKETWKKELEEKLGIVQKEWEEKSERNGVALQEQCKEANEKLRKMEEQLMKMMEELKVTKEQHEKEKKEMEGQMNKMMEAMMKAEREQAEKDRAKKIQDEKDRAKKYQDEVDRAKKYQDELDRAKKEQDEKMKMMGESSEEWTLQSGKAAADLL
ncbi:golgin subfamily A member 6-like protein 7 [Rana temporaria]|uniref:golgin subfamily A member 6-like protein 7 n=1 Tax=Rana temporaria TaxID=8407 RepID=UPI001AAE14DB|nr:golgin subfamily A member 6-like protein 7 [Rana temporaria]